MLSPRLCFAIAAFAAPLCLAPPARSQECIQQRPTDPQGYLGFTYGAAPVASFGSGDVLVWYALSGPHAPDLASTRPDDVPDDVARAATVGDDALARYAAMGFRAPPSDGGALPCSSNGGDGRLDVYLVNFGGGSDGAAAAENCVASGAGFACSSFVLVERGLGSHYGTFDVGIRTVLPHELFHAVQNAYSAETDRYWAEGTAQWATDALYPELTDMERFFPAFLSDTDRPLNFGGGGVVAGFLYGSAIWPLFLSQRYDTALLLDTFERQNQTGEPATSGVAAALATRGGSLAAEFPLFATWNAATGTRAGTGGYAAAASYPEVTVEPLGVDGTAAGKMAGLSARYFAFAAERPHRITSVVDPARLATHFVPLEGGKANLGATRALPTDAAGEGVIVVAGTSTSLADAPFSISTTLLPDPPPVPTMPPPTPTTPPTTPPPTPTTPPAPTAPPAPTTPPTNVTPVAPTDDDGGCALASPGSTDRAGAPAALWIGAGLLLGATARRRVSRAAGAAPARRGKGATT
jgi:hypothetical protein